MLLLAHSYFSLQTGVCSPWALAEAAAVRGYEALAITDVNGMYGAVHAFNAIRAAGLIPLVGAELLLNRDVWCTVLVTSVTGYRQLCRLLSAYHLDPGFDWVADAGRTTDLIFLARTGYAENLLRPVVHPRRLYAVSGDRPQDRFWRGTDSRVPRAELPDVWLLGDDDRQTFADLAKLRSRGRHANGLHADDTGAVLTDRQNWHASHPGYERIAREIVDACRFAFDLEACYLPQITFPGGESAEARLAGLCRARIPVVYGRHRRVQAEQRLRHELDVITGNGFAGYFLYVNEIIGHARRRDIPVDVRGSAASSIVAYLLGFTHCCPLENDLYFERFMNPGRKDCPDIDVDIADNRRDEIVDYCYKTWGEDHVAMVATVQTCRRRGALRDAARALEIPPETVSRFIKLGEPFAESAAVCELAARLTGLPRHLGVHCGGLVITPFPLTDITPLFRAAKGVVTIHYEKEQAKMLGLVKMDLLGNSGLSVIAEGCRLLAKRGLDLPEKGPVHDYKVNRLFANGDTLGIYQCESPAMRSICRAMRPGSKADVAMALSLIRPGPAAAGMKDAFIRRLKGLEGITYMHPKMADFLHGTYGVMLYQEDVMKVAVELAGYSLEEADNLRRAVKGGGDDLFCRERERFVGEKAATCGMPAGMAEKIWAHVSQFASYSYCKAHASVYGRLAWLTARLKAHYPAEFYAAVLNCHQSMYPKRVFVWDAIRHGIPVLPPDIRESEWEWQPTRHGVRAGLGIVRGIRRGMCRQLLCERAAQPFKTLADLRRRVDFSGDDLENLILLGACRSLGDRGALLASLRDWDKKDGSYSATLAVAEEHPWGIRPSSRRGGAGTGGTGGLQPPVSEDDPRARLPPVIRMEMVLTGIPFSLHPAEVVGRELVSAADMPRKINCHVSMFGILDTLKRTWTGGRNTEQRAMSFVTLEDASGLFEAILFPDQYERYGDLFRSSGPYLVSGVVRAQWDSLTLELDDAVRCA